MSKSKTSKGMVARRRPNPSNPSCTIVEYVKAPEGKTNERMDVCSTCGKPFTRKSNDPSQTQCSECLHKAEQAAQLQITKAALAKKKMIDEAIHLNCVTCGKHFYITQSKAAKLKSLGLPLYTECYACQQAKEQKAAGQKEVTQ